MIIFLYLALLAVAFFAFVVRPQRRQLAQRRALIASLEVGDEVITAGGLYGTIRAIDETKLSLEVADGVLLNFAREAISGRQVAETGLDASDTPDRAADIDLDARLDAAPDPSHAEPGE